MKTTVSLMPERVWSSTALEVFSDDIFLPPVYSLDNFEPGGPSHLLPHGSVCISLLSPRGGKRELHGSGREW
jgi:hypothetical protein